MISAATAQQRGMIVEAFEAYVRASEKARIDIKSRADGRLVQLIGNAAASAGYHAKDSVHGGFPYTTAADCSVRGLSNSQKATWIDELCLEGFVAFYRNWRDNLHIHMNWAGAPQKPQLDRQNEDFFAGRDGLVGHRRIDQEWWYPDLDARKIPEAMFRLSNPRDGKKGRFVTRANVVKPVVQDITFGLYLNRETRPRLWMPVVDGVSYAPVRAWGAIMGFDTQYNPATQTVIFDKEVDTPIAIKLFAGVGHAPIRTLVTEAELRIVKLDVANRKVVVSR